MSEDNHEERVNEFWRHHNKKADDAYQRKRTDDEISLTEWETDSIRDAYRSQATKESLWSEEDERYYRADIEKGKTSLLEDISSYFNRKHEWYKRLEAIRITDNHARSSLQMLYELISEHESALLHQVNTLKNQELESGNPRVDLFRLKMLREAGHNVRQIKHLKISLKALMSSQNTYIEIRHSWR